MPNEDNISCATRGVYTSYSNLPQEPSAKRMAYAPLRMWDSKLGCLDMPLPMRVSKEPKWLY